MNVQLSLIRELLLYEFELCHNVLVAIKNICCTKSQAQLSQNVRKSIWSSQIVPHVIAKLLTYPKIIVRVGVHNETEYRLMKFK